MRAINECCPSQPCAGTGARVFAVLLLLLAPAWVNGADTTVATLTLEELRQRHALPSSRYATVDGMNLHYVDEGSGPVVVLLHASYQGLRSWDPLAARLRERFRVVRFDFPNAGLSSDDKPVPEEKFDMMARYVGALFHLMRELDIDRFALLGTSSGGTAAFRYASIYPGQVQRLVLINSAGMPRTPRTDPLRERPAMARWEGMKVRPRAFWEFALADNFIAPNRAPAWFVDQAFDYARREGLAAKRADYVYETGDPKRVLADIVAPTLIMWGKANPTVMHLEADVMAHWMTAAPTAVRKYPGLGHYPYVEDLDAIYSDLLAFLTGAMDTALRRTVRLPADMGCACGHASD